MRSILVTEKIPFARYGDRTLCLDLYRPRVAPRPLPVVVWVCGGGWRGWSSAGRPTWLAEQGFAVAAIEYRVSSEAIAPANIQDCKAAVRWLRANAIAHHLDPEKIGAFGSSAGGHLVALLGTSAGANELEGDGGSAGLSSAVQAVCAFCGPSDLTRIAIPAIRQQFALLYEVTEQYLGGPVEQRPDLARLVSPLTYVSAKSPPFLIAHGDADDIVPVEESLVLHAALQKAGADVTLRILKGAGHGWEESLTNAAVLAFFRRTLS